MRLELARMIGESDATMTAIQRALGRPHQEGIIKISHEQELVDGQVMRVHRVIWTGPDE